MRHADEAKERRNEKIRQLRKRQTLNLVSAVLLVVFVGAAGYAVVNSNFWLIKTITIKGTKRLTPEKVVEIAQVDYNTNLIKLPMTEIETRLKQNPWVAEVVLNRGLPNRLTIELKERAPFVGVKQNGRIFILDETGYNIESVSQLATDTAVPVIDNVRLKTLKVGKRIRRGNLLTAIKSLKGLAPDIREKVIWVSVPSVEKIAFHTVENLEIIFGGPEDTAKKNYLIKKILSSSTEKVVHVNVSVPATPVVRKLKI